MIKTVGYDNDEMLRDIYMNCIWMVMYRNVI